MKSFDNIVALSYLKKSLYKWKTVAILSLVLSLLLLIKLTHGDSISSDSALSVGHNNSYIANVKIDGIIFEDDYRSEVLRRIEEEDDIKAVLLNIDSPGGGIVGSEILFNELRKISRKKPVVAIMHSMAASGGYMIAIASDYILAHNGTITGSIGVLVESPEITELAEKIGVKFNTYKSSPLKGSPSPFEKANSASEQVIKDSIKDSYDFFTSLVLERRGDRLNKNLISTVLDGRIFTGRQAINVGLVDAIGGRDEALIHLEEVYKIDSKLPVKEVDVVEQKDGLVEKFLTAIPFLNRMDGSAKQRQIMAIAPSI